MATTTLVTGTQQTQSLQLGSSTGTYPFRVRAYRTEAEMKASYSAIRNRLNPPPVKVNIVQNETPKIVEVLRVVPHIGSEPPAEPVRLPIVPTVDPADIYPPRVSLRDIKVVITREFGISLAELIGPMRNARYVIPRHIAMWLSRTMMPMSMPELGRRFGGRDHTTVLNACRKIDALKLSPEWADRLAVLMSMVQACSVERQAAEKAV